MAGESPLFLTTIAARGFHAHPRYRLEQIAPPIATPPGRLKLAPQWLLFAGLALAIPLAPILLTRAAPRLPELGELPAFALTDQLGRPFGRGDLRGKVWVADFVFTSCSDACPRLTQRMKTLQDRLDPAGRIGLLSISVDPERDTPQKLRDYGAAFGARDDLWRFLTGSPTEVERTVVKGFRIAMAKVPLPKDAVPASEDDLRAQAFDIMHGDRLVLVDAGGRIRGYYVADDDGLHAILRDARALAARG